MLNPRLASRYAKSILDLAIERNEVDKVFQDMEWLYAAIKSSRELVNLLRSPIINLDTKNKIMSEVTKGKIGELTAAFVKLLVQKGRESVLPEIVNSFLAQYRAFKKIYQVRLTTAIPASEDMKKMFITHLTKTTEMKNIELETVVDEEIIGGFVLQAGDKLVDASVLYDLKTIERQFENNDFIYRVR
jgi:F-type H+-transporting ATPase subunit delta